MKFTKSLFALVTACALLGVTTARAQFYTFNSFTKGYFNLLVTSPSQVTNSTIYAGTNQAMAFGANNYVFNGSYAATANNSYIGTNTIINSGGAFGWQTNTIISDADIWPDNNSDLCNNEAVFISVTGVNNTSVTPITFTFAPVVSVAIPVGSGTITNDVVMTQNTWNVNVTANGTTPVNQTTNPPNGMFIGARKLRLISATITATNAIGYSTNYTLSTTLTNGVWQNVTNTAITTNWGGAYVNLGVSGFPPFHSP
jgi:hypothetical protein